MRDTVFMTGGMISSDTRAQNCSFDSATVTEGPPDNTQPITVFECAVIGTLPPVANPNGASKTEFAIAGSSSTDVSFGSLKSTTTWGMYTLAYNGSGSLLWTHVVHGGAIFPKAILAMDPSIGGAPLAGKWGVGVDSESLPSRDQPPDATRTRDVGSVAVDKETTSNDHAVVDGTYIYVAAEVADWLNASDFGRTRLPLECSQDKRVGEKNAPLERLADTPCAGKVVSKGSAASWPRTSALRSDIVLAQFLAQNGEVQQLRRTGQTDIQETVSALAAHPLTGTVYLAGEYYSAGASSSVQGNEASGGGEDVFGLNSASRADAVGCSRQRWTGDLSRGQAGVPDCRLYTHASSPTLPTGYVAKYSFDGDGATSRRRQLPSITGYLELASTWAPCAGGQTSGDTDGATHVLTGASACSTHVSGCSCLSVVFKSRTVAGGSEDGDVTASPYGTGPRSKFSGYLLRIVNGKSMGFEGIISSYNTQQRLYNIIPSLPVAGVDETSQFQLFPSSRNTPRLHLPNCNKAADVGCSAYGVEWAKTVGYAIGGGDQSIAQSSGVALAEMDSDIYVAGHFSGFTGGWAGYKGPSRIRAPPSESTVTRSAVGSPSFGVEGVDELIGFANPSATQVSSFLSKLAD
jgi:hypothetical protein